MHYIFDVIFKCPYCKHGHFMTTKPVEHPRVLVLGERVNRPVQCPDCKKFVSESYDIDPETGTFYYFKVQVKEIIDADSQENKWQ